MGGKSFYCDYCSCYMKNDVNVRKVHNAGLLHKLAKTRYMQKYQDPRKILASESTKMPCKRFLNGGYCKFDLCCQFSHYNQKQMQQLKEAAIRLEQQIRRKQFQNVKTAEWANRLPWNMLECNRGRTCRKKIKRLPQSLKPINFNKLAHCSTGLDLSENESKVNLKLYELVHFLY